MLPRTSRQSDLSRSGQIPSKQEPITVAELSGESLAFLEAMISIELAWTLVDDTDSKSEFVPSRISEVLTDSIEQCRAVSVPLFVRIDP
jgi:hypothetical protein